MSKKEQIQTAYTQLDHPVWRKQTRLLGACDPQESWPSLVDGKFLRTCAHEQAHVSEGRGDEVIECGWRAGVL